MSTNLESQTTEQQTAQTNEQDAALADALKAFDKPAQQGSLIPSLSRQSLLSEETTDNQEAAEFLESQNQEEELEQEDSEQNQETEAEESPSNFDAEFKSRFGLDPQEATEVINELRAFQQEYALVKEWGVTPSEFQSRINEVGKFFDKLPEDQRGQFDSVEGIKAIWNHLVETGKVQTVQPRKTKPGMPTGSQKPSAPKLETIKRSEILNMDRNTFKQNYARITQAFLDGRVIEDV